MPVVDIGHMSMLMLCLWMLVFVSMNNIILIMIVEVFMSMPMFVHHRHVDVKMGVFFVCQ